MVLFPGRRRRKHDEAACNIKEREEREWRRRLKSQRPLEKKTGIGWRGLPRYRSSWEDMTGLDGNQVLRRGVGWGGDVQVETHQKGGWISVQQQDDECQPNNNIP